jgi:hypothetical protein
MAGFETSLGRLDSFYIAQVGIGRYIGSSSFVVAVCGGGVFILGHVHLIIRLHRELFEVTVFVE